MKRKLTALLLAMTFVFATVAPTMAASKHANGSANKTATVSVERSKRRFRPLKAVVQLFSNKKEESVKSDDVAAKKVTQENTENKDNGGNDGSSDEQDKPKEEKKSGESDQENDKKDEEETNPEKKFKTAKFTFSLINESKEELADAKFQIVRKDVKPEKIWDNKDASSELELEPGSYEFRLADKLKGYKKPVAIEFKIGKSGEVSLEGGSLTIKKDKYLLIMKTEKEEETKTLFGIRGIDGKELAGAELQIVEKPKKAPSGDVTTARTWNLGKTPEELKLDEGKYELVVTKLPDGYKIEKTSVDFEITEDGEIKVAEADKEHLEIEGAEYNLFLKAAPTENQFFFRLKDSNGKDIIGPELQIKDSAGRTIKWFSEKNVKGINISDFADGVYEFSQTTVPYGHSAAESIRFTVKDHKIIEASYGLTDFGPYQELALVSKSAKRVVTFSRVDSLGKILLGVEIEIYKDGTKIASWKSGSDHHKLELEAGVYRYHEAAVVLSHKIAKDFEFEIKADGSIVLRGIQLGEMVKLKEGGLICVGEAGGKLEEDPNKKPEGKPGQTNQKKPTTDKKAQAKNHWVEFDVAKKDGTLLEGAVVEIYQNGKLLESWTTSNTGYKTQLQQGSYRFHTKTAPQGYQLARDFNFAVNRDGSITLGKLQSGDTVTAKDGRIVVYGDPVSATGARTSGTTTAASNGRLPKTGDGISPVFYAVGLAAVGAVILGIGIKKRRESVDEVK